MSRLERAVRLAVEAAETASGERAKSSSVSYLLRMEAREVMVLSNKSKSSEIEAIYAKCI